jgi:dimethylargininase
MIGEELIVGETKRTNKQGIISLQFAFPSIPVYYVNLESLSWNAGMEHTPLHLKSFCSLLAPHHVIVGDNIGTELMKWFRNRTAQRDSAMSLIKQFPEFQSQTKQITEIEETFAKKYASQYLFVCVPDQEAANCVYINQTVLRRSGKEFPESGKIFERVKLPQIEIDASELSKVDGAITCCSLLF